MKEVYIDKLDDALNKYNNTYRRTTKIKPVDVKPSIYIDSNKEINDEDPKFKIGDIVRMSKYKNNFAKGYVPNCSEEVFAIKKVRKLKTLCHGHYLISHLKDGKIFRTFYRKELQKANQKRVYS